MTILEQILAGLQTKFTGVDAAILTRIATKKAEGVTDASQVNSIVEGVGFSDVLNSYGDFRANTAVTSAVSNYEKKHGLKDGKPIENPNPQPTPPPAPQPAPTDDMATIIANAVNAAVKPLSDEIAQFKVEKSQATRQEQILAKAKEYGIPESQAKRYGIPDDADLDAYFKEVKQELTNEGFEGVKVPESGDATPKSDDDAVADLIGKGTKEIVEQSKK